MALVMMPMSTIAPRIAARIGRRNTMVTGVTIFAAGLAMMALKASVEGGYMSILPGLLLIGLGMGLNGGFRSAIAPKLAGLPAELAEPASDGIGSAFAVAANAGEQGPLIIDAAKHAFVDGWVQSMWLGVGMAAVALLYLLVRGPARPTARRTDEPIASITGQPN
jgi:dipeptide/tripeptide permease